MAESKIIIVGNQKGGVGKSTVSSHIVNTLFFDYKKSCCLVDADQQQTVSKWRKMELANASSDGHPIKEDDLYALLAVNINDCAEIVSQSLFGEYDYIFIDLPGDLQMKEVRKMYVMADYVFVPTSYEPHILNSTIDFIKFYKKDIAPIRSKNKMSINIHAFMNKINPRMKEFEQFMEEKNGLGIPVMKSYLTLANIAFNRNFSTCKMIKQYGKDFELNTFCEEIIQILEN